MDVTFAEALAAPGVVPLDVAVNTPVDEFTAVNPGAISYFEGLDASNANPVFTQIWGRQVSETIVRTITEESAFGEAHVREVRTPHKDWIITGARPEPYVWDDESTLTAAEVNEAGKAREIMLATLK